MKLHLPLLLRKSVLVGASVLTALSQFSVTAYAESQNLIFSGTNLTWDTCAENKAFIVAAEETTSAFAQGDNVSFISTSDVALGENITVGTISIEEGADITLNQQNYSLTAEKIAVSGTLDMGESLYVGSGTTLAIQSSSAVLKSNLILSDEGSLSVNGSASMNNNTLILHGGTDFSLFSTADGRVYNLFSNVSKLMDAEGNTISLDSTNNKAALYFDASQPGTGFWKNARLQLSVDKKLQLVRYTEISLPDYDSTVVVDSLDDITSYSSNSESVVFRVDGGKLDNNCIIVDSQQNLIMTRSTKHWCFASASSDNLSSLCFSNSTSKLFENSSYHNLEFAYLNEVGFISNMSTPTDYDGGVIATDYLRFRDNGSVLFYGNKTETETPLDGGAVCIQVDVEFSGNGCVKFSSNTVNSSSAAGGAINGTYTYITDNNDVIFEGNKAISKSTAWGGAIASKMEGRVNICGNARVMFSENSAVGTQDGAMGGAIYTGRVTLEDNGEVVFSKNITGYSSKTHSGVVNWYDGGAVNAYVTAKNNDVIIFEDNLGGAIGGACTFSHNGSVIFRNNSVYNEYSLGGAINARGDVSLCDNGYIEFSGNSSSSYTHEGGAVFARYGLNIRNNDSAIFQGNVVSENGALLLRSIYAENGNSVVSFSAAAGKQIIFRDSVYIGERTSLDLNNKYGEVEQSGDIVFSGEYTEQHLNDWITNNENRQSATLTEIENSRTSVVNCKTTLYGGTLKVESEAILQLNGGLEVTAESNATVLVKNATLDASSSDNLGVDINGGRLELRDAAKVLGANIDIANGATLAAVAGEACEIDTLITAATLTLDRGDEVISQVFNSEIGGIITGNLTLQAGSSLVADGAHFVFGDDSELNIEVNYSEKIHLWLTEGVEYGDANQILLFSNVGSLTITVDGEIIDYSNGVLATTVFDGDWVNDDLMLYIDDSNVFVKNVNLVPEPTTATLSLLALAGLAARRRRK